MKLCISNVQGLELKCYYVRLYASGCKIVQLRVPPKEVYFLLCFAGHHCLHNTKKKHENSDDVIRKSDMKIEEEKLQTIIAYEMQVSNMKVFKFRCSVICIGYSTRKF